MASALATELTREWIEINSTETADDATKEKVTELTQALKDIGLQQVIQRAAEQDAYFGRAQLFIDLKGHERDIPLVISSKTIGKGTWKDIRVVPVEAIWTTPMAYNAIDPAAPDFYKPSKWFMLGKEVHASRLLTVITRPLADILKPAFNFGGMSLSQLAEPYVNNWTRTWKSVGDLVNNFSIVNLSTSMDQVLTDPNDDGTSVINRIELFNAHRTNRGTMVTDKDREELEVLATPLAGLHELEAQALELLCFVSRLPAVILLGIEPSGLNASSEGSIRSLYDWIAALQENYWRSPIDIIFKILQLLMHGEIDPDLTWSFVPLFQMTGKELSEIRTADANVAAAYIDRGVIAPEEEREKIARDPESGYQGLDLSVTPEENDDEEK
jgi:hypothetical protein